MNMYCPADKTCENLGP